jgi:hypothetical protein
MLLTFAPPVTRASSITCALHDFPGGPLRLRRRLRPRLNRRKRPDNPDPLAGIEIPSPFDIRLFCENVAARRRRPLHVEAVEGISGADELCGLWIELEDSDCIFYESSTSPLHCHHIILHEISHMLLGHSSVNDVNSGAIFDELFTGIDPRTVRSVLARANFDDPQEQEAERLANRIARLADLPSVAPGRAPELNRLDTALRSE